MSMTHTRRTPMASCLACIFGWSETLPRYHVAS